MEKALELQNQVRNNAAEIQDFLKDMDNWESNIKKKDDKLQKQKHGVVEEEKELPPVRNASQRPKKVKKKEKPVESEKQKEAKKKKLRAYDYRSWDKYDVDKELAALDDGDRQSSSEYETDSEAELEAERKQQQAVFEKDRGNSYFKKGQYKEAVHCYTIGMECDPFNAILPANRAMAYIKMEKYVDAETDCTAALSIDYTYVKAYHRRGTARIELGKLEEAEKDFEQVLNIEPSNKPAMSELKRIGKLMLQREEDARKEAEKAAMAIVKPIEKKPHERSKKPLRRIQIEEIGSDGEEEENDVNAANKQTETHAVTKATTDTVENPTFTSPADVIKAASNNSNSHKTDLEINGRLQEEPSGNLISEVNSKTKSEEKIVKEESNVKSKPVKESVSTPTVPKPVPVIPDVPTTSFQLQTDWRKLQGFPEQLYKYFKQIPPSNYSKLFQQSLDSIMLNKILCLLKDYYIQNEEPVFDVLKNLSNVKRFSMNIMFMSSKEKQVVKDLFKYLESVQSDKATEIEALAKTYEL
ncbi:RNA polymerase II-associated protein 3-like [Glandiceps talaboti]